MKEFVLTLILFLVSAILFGQTISGKVSDNKNQAVNQANVLLYIEGKIEPLNQTTTDENGNFQFKSVEVGSYYIEVSSLEFDTYETEVFTIQSNQNLEKNITLETTESVDLEGVSITAKKPTITQTAEKLTVDLTDTNQVSANVLDILKKIPGVFVANGRVNYAGQSNITILINGKTTNYIDLNTLLKEFPADDIAKIEVIPQPGSDYDAEGSGPIINLVLKKGAKLGTYGSATAMIGYTDTWVYRTGANMTSYKNKLNWQAGFSYARNSYREVLGIKRDVQGTIYDQVTDSPFDPTSFRLNVGLDYYFTPEHSVGLRARTTQSASTRTAVNQTNIIESTNNDLLLTNNLIDSDWNFYKVNPYYEFKTKEDKHKFNFDFDYVDFQSEYDNDLLQTETSNIDYTNQRNEQSADSKLYTFKADYEYKMTDDFTFKTGSKFSSYESENDLLAFLEDANGVFVNNPNLTNLFLIDETIFALYGKANYSVEKWNFSAGLRWEDSRTKGTSRTINQSNERNISELFPSGTIGYNLTKKITANLAYSRRIQRPSYSSLNPFVYFYDPFTFEQGNPNLRPSFTNSYRFSLTYAKQPFFNIEYRDTNDALFEIVQQNDATGETSRTRINLDKRENWSFSLFGPLNFIKNVDGYVGVIVNYNRYEDQNLPTPLELDKWNWTGVFGAEYSFPANIKAELNGWYTSGGLEGQIDYDWLTGLDFSLSKTFFDEKFRVNFTLSEIFNRKWNGAIDYANINADIFSDWNRQNVRLQVTYNFGKKLKKKQKTSNASQEELNRLDTDN